MSAPEGAAPKGGPVWLRNVLVLVAATAIVIGGIWAVDAWRGGTATAQSSSTSAASGEGVSVGEKAPAFTATALDGSTVSLEELRGRPVWLVFNATWCTDCRTEAPDIEALHEEYGDRVAIIGVYVDDAEQTVRDWSATLGLDYPQVVDADSSIGAAYEVLGIPAHVFIDEDGVVASTRTGTLSPSMMRERLADLVG